jgi:hypothetical protein
MHQWQHKYTFVLRNHPILTNLTQFLSCNASRHPLGISTSVLEGIAHGLPILSRQRQFSPPRH